jgi:hypothetical protein
MKAVFIRKALPQWSMTCEECRTWVHDDNGRIKLTQSQTPIQLRRPPGSIPPCYRCPKVSKAIQKDDKITKKWEHAADVAGDIEAVYDHYRMCKTVSRFPDDELVAANALQIADAEAAAAEQARSMAEDRMDYLLNRLIAKK